MFRKRPRNRGTETKESAPVPFNCLCDAPMHAPQKVNTKVIENSETAKTFCNFFTLAEGTGI